MRGKHKALAKQDRATGITPAGAGKTPNIPPLKRKLGDHPRRCGENRSISAEHFLTNGSPPQVRGKRELNALCYINLRITPAGAGKTKRSNTITTGP